MALEVSDPSTLSPSAQNSDPFFRQLLAAMVDFRGGNFTPRMPVDLVGLPGKFADVFNDVVNMAQRRSGEIERVSPAVGKEGRLKELMRLPVARGLRAAEVTAINSL